MRSITLAEAKARLSEVVDQVEAGDSVAITRDGKAVAQLTPMAVHRKLIDQDILAALTAIIPAQPQNAADLVRRMRDADRA